MQRTHKKGVNHTRKKTKKSSHIHRHAARTKLCRRPRRALAARVFPHLDCPGVEQVAKSYAGSLEAGGVRACTDGSAAGSGDL